MIFRTTTSTLSPYTTLFRSQVKHLGVWGNIRENVIHGKITALLEHCCFNIGRAIPIQIGPLVGVFGQRKTVRRSEEHTSELQSRGHLVCRLLLEKKQSITFT